MIIGQGKDGKEPAARTMYYCYILYSLKTNIFYIDFAGDIDQAITSHNNARVVSTKPHLPWELVWHEEFATEQQACQRARQLKSRSAAGFVYKSLLAALAPDIFGRRAGNFFGS